MRHRIQLRQRLSHPVANAIAAQVAGVALLWILGQRGWLTGLSPLTLAATQGILAAASAVVLHAPRWWLLIHLVFAPLLVAAAALRLPPLVYLLAFIMLWLIYWTAFRTQVPLFLSNLATVHRVAAFLPDTPNCRVLDVGSGTGSFLRHLAKLRPDWRLFGIELAPAPWLLSRWLSRHQTQIQITRADFWQCHLRDFEAVYAFLSPVPMRALWQKARNEMAPGSWFISNSFDIPGVQPDHVLPVAGTTRTLYCYQI